MVFFIDILDMMFILFSHFDFKFIFITDLIIFNPTAVENMF